jgi:hypothetical protein
MLFNDDVRKNVVRKYFFVQSNGTQNVRTQSKNVLSNEASYQEPILRPWVTTPAL